MSNQLIAKKAVVLMADESKQAEAVSTTVISTDGQERLRQFFKDLADYRELFITFVERDLKVRYRQTVLGAVWVVLQPLMLTGAFALIFGRIAEMPTDGLPLVLFYFAANMPWNALSRSVTGAALSMESNAALITKVYFPRIVVPCALVIATFVDFAIGFALFNFIAAFQGHWHWEILAVMPLLVLIQTCMALGIGLALAALNAQYRDVRQGVHFLVQLLMLATPVIYPLSRVLHKLPDWAHPFVALNPMSAVVEGYRSGLRGEIFDWQITLLSLVVAFLYLFAGVWFFRKREAKLVDII